MPAEQGSPQSLPTPHMYSHNVACQGRRLVSFATDILLIGVLPARYK